MYHNKSVSSFSVDVGDIVYTLVQQSNSTLAPKFTRPYRVIKKETGNKVKLLHLHTFAKSGAHLEQMKKVSWP